AVDPDDCDEEPIVVSDAPAVALNVLTGNMWTVGARAGFLASPGTLIYALAGYTHLDMVASASVTSLFTTGTELDPFAFEMNTLTVGVGFETALSTNLTAKLEYRATVVSTELEYSAISVSPSAAPPAPDLGVRFFDTSVVQTVRGGLSWRIGNN
ncbi:MAG: outer membrane protein, partial [Alphaproteobacteria bacterium]